MAYVAGDRVVVNETAYWGTGRHGVVISVGEVDQGATPERPISVYLDNYQGSSPFFAESMLDPE
jgi:hypothetical protein